MSIIPKYISRKKGKDACALLSIPERSYYRKIKEGEICFEEAIKKQGYDEKRLEDMLKGEEWILDLKREFESTKKENEIVFNPNFVKKKVAI